MCVCVHVINVYVPEPLCLEQQEIRNSSLFAGLKQAVDSAWLGSIAVLFHIFHNSIIVILQPLAAGSYGNTEKCSNGNTDPTIYFK